MLQLLLGNFIFIYSTTNNLCLLQKVTTVSEDKATIHRKSRFCSFFSNLRAEGRRLKDTGISRSSGKKREKSMFLFGIATLDSPAALLLGGIALWISRSSQEAWSSSTQSFYHRTALYM